MDSAQEHPNASSLLGPQNQYDEDFEEINESQLESRNKLQNPEAVPQKAAGDDEDSNQQIVKSTSTEPRLQIEKDSRSKVVGKDLKDVATQNKIKDTISKITQSILHSKQQITEDISIINQYQEQNQRQMKQKQLRSSKYSLGRHSALGTIDDTKNLKKKLLQAEKEKVLNQLRAKEEQRRRKKQIYQDQKIQRKEKEELQKNRSRMKERQIQKRIIYEQRFVSRKNNSPEELPAFDQEDIKVLEEVYIQKIKDRLNIGASRKKVQYHSVEPKLSTRPERRKKVSERQEALKKYSKKINQDNKFKQRIIANLKIKRENSRNTPLTGRDGNPRNFHSAPSLRLPTIARQASKRRSIYSGEVALKGQGSEQFFQEVE